MKLHFVDTETTGLVASAHEIIDIAIITQDRGVTTHTFHSKVMPEWIADADPEALRINGYKPMNWDLAPSWSEIGPIVNEILSDGIIVGHNVNFDYQFIREGIQRLGHKPKMSRRTIDTITLVYEHLYPMGLESASLKSVREFLGMSSEGAHTALQDTRDTQVVFNTLWRMNPLDKLLLQAKIWQRKAGK